MQSFLFFLQLVLLTAFEQHLSSLIISTCSVEIMEKEFAGSSHCHLYTSFDQRRTYTKLDAFVHRDRWKLRRIHAFVHQP